MIKIIPILLEKIGLFYYLNNQMWSKYIKYFWQWNNMKQQMHYSTVPWENCLEMAFSNMVLQIFVVLSKWKLYHQRVGMK